MSWKLISKLGLAPVTEIWQYTSNGRKYILTFDYYFDVKGNINVFGYPHLISNKKEYIFVDVDELQRFLQKRKVPLPPILWSK
jgi:hypothetical protein